MPQATEYVRNVPVSPFKLCTEKKKKKGKTCDTSGNSTASRTSELEYPLATALKQDFSAFVELWVTPDFYLPESQPGPLLPFSLEDVAFGSQSIIWAKVWQEVNLGNFSFVIETSNFLTIWENSNSKDEDQKLFLEEGCYPCSLHLLIKLKRTRGPVLQLSQACARSHINKDLHCVKVGMSTMHRPHPPRSLTGDLPRDTWCVALCGSLPRGKALSEGVTRDLSTR